MMRYMAIWMWLLFISPCWSAWFTYNPPGSVDGKGILQEVVSRCDEQGRRTGHDPDKVTCCHESSHMLSSRIRQTAGGTGKVNAFYVGGGKCFILNEPKVTIGQVAQYVPQEFRNSTYQLYFVQQRKYWDNEPLYILDEQNAYINGAQAAVELKVDDHGEFDRAEWFNAYADALVMAVLKHDPQYVQFGELSDFVAWQRARVERLLGKKPERSILVKAVAASDPQPADIPLEWRELNRDGSCVHISYANSMRHLGLHDRAAEYRRRYKHGESPGPHKRKLEEFGAKYAMTTDGDPKLIEYAIANRRMISWTDMSAHYRNLVGRKDGKAVLLGNGPQGRESYQYVPWEEAMRAFNNQGGWAVVCLEGCPPPPSPR
jgi:hypothetical protein